MALTSYISVTCNHLMPLLFKGLKLFYFRQHSLGRASILYLLHMQHYYSTNPKWLPFSQAPNWKGCSHCTSP